MSPTLHLQIMFSLFTFIYCLNRQKIWSQTETIRFVEGGDILLYLSGVDFYKKHLSNRNREIIRTPPKICFSLSPQHLERHFGWGATPKMHVEFLLLPIHQTALRARYMISSKVSVGMPSELMIGPRAKWWCQHYLEGNILGLMVIFDYLASTITGHIIRVEGSETGHPVLVGISITRQCIICIGPRCGDWLHKWVTRDDTRYD